MENLTHKCIIGGDVLLIPVVLNRWRRVLVS